MATKKHHKNVKHHLKAKKPKESNAGTVVGVIVAVIVVIALILLFRGGGETPAPEIPSSPEPVVKEAPTPAPAPEQVSDSNVAVTLEATTEAPEIVKSCTGGVSLGYVPCSCAQEGDVMKITLKNSGKVKLTGMWFKMAAEDGTASYFYDDNNLGIGKEGVYSVNLNKLQSLLGGAVKNMNVMPSTDGEKACLNAQLTVLKGTNCVASCSYENPGVY